MALDKDELAASRKKIQENIERQEQDRRRRLQGARIDIAKMGVVAYDERKLKEAAQAFFTYIKILEELKGCGEGGLRPSQFDLKKDAAELLLISGVYWDLAKMFDRAKLKDKEFRHYIEKFLLFSKGMPYQPVCVETLRKYISTERTMHRSDFRNALKQLDDRKCFVATALWDVTELSTQTRLRTFRDQVLLPKPMGRVLIRIYYRIGPWLGKAVSHLPSSIRRGLGLILDWAAPLIAD